MSYQIEKSGVQSHPLLWMESLDPVFSDSIGTNHPAIVVQKYVNITSRDPLKEVDGLGLIEHVTNPNIAGYNGGKPNMDTDGHPWKLAMKRRLHDILKMDDFGETINSISNRFRNELGFLFKPGYNYNTPLLTRWVPTGETADYFSKHSLIYGATFTDAPHIFPGGPPLLGEGTTNGNPNAPYIYDPHPFNHPLKISYNGSMADASVANHSYYSIIGKMRPDLARQYYSKAGRGSLNPMLEYIISKGSTAGHPIKFRYLWGEKLFAPLGIKYTELYNPIEAGLRMSLVIPRSGQWQGLFDELVRKLHDKPTIPEYGAPWDGGLKTNGTQNDYISLLKEKACIISELSNVTVERQRMGSYHTHTKTVGHGPDKHVYTETHSPPIGFTGNIQKSSRQDFLVIPLADVSERLYTDDAPLSYVFEHPSQEIKDKELISQYSADFAGTVPGQGDFEGMQLFVLKEGTTLTSVEQSALDLAYYWQWRGKQWMMAGLPPGIDSAFAAASGAEVASAEAVCEEGAPEPGASLYGSPQNIVESAPLGAEESAGDGENCTIYNEKKWEGDFGVTIVKWETDCTDGKPKLNRIQRQYNPPLHSIDHSWFLNNRVSLKDKLVQDKNWINFIDNIIPLRELAASVAINQRNMMDEAYPDLEQAAGLKNTKSQLIKLLETQEASISDPTNTCTEDPLSLLGRSSSFNFDVGAVVYSVLRGYVQAIANVTDPTWRTPWFAPGPFTPVGAIAKAMGPLGGSKSKEEAAEDYCEPDVSEPE
jgi:hypothetical protein